MQQDRNSGVVRSSVAWPAYNLEALPAQAAVAEAILAIPGVLAAVLVYTWLRERRVADRETRCGRCGYILRGITESRCPECGEGI